MGKYVYHIEKFNDSFYDSDSDYSIRIIDGTLYRFDYITNNIATLVPAVFAVRYFRAADQFPRKIFQNNNFGNIPVIITVNIILTIMTLAVFLVLFYIRKKILRPFERLINVPYVTAVKIFFQAFINIDTPHPMLLRFSVDFLGFPQFFVLTI